MTIDKKHILTTSLIVTIIFIIYLVSKTMSTNEDKNIYIEINIDGNIINNTIVNIELQRNSTEYDEYIEKRLITLEQENNSWNETININDSYSYEIFINVDNKNFLNISKDQIYTHLDTDVKNKFKIIEVDNEIFLLDYGLHKTNEKYPSTYDSYPLKDKNISEIPNFEKFMQSSINDRFVVQPMSVDSINYFSKLSPSELQEFKFIPSDKEKIEALSEK